MAKRLLNQLRVRTADPSRKRGKRKLVIRPVTDASHTVTDFESPPGPAQAEPTPDPEQEVPKTQSVPWRPYWRWSLVWLSVVLIFGGTGIVGVLLLTTLPPPPDCDRMQPLAPDSQQLYCAQQAAQSGKLDQLVAAMNLVNSWPENHPLYLEAQRKMEEWSQAIVAIGQQKMNQGNLEGAIAIVRKIPVNSPYYPEAQAKVADWQQDWKRGEKIAATVEEAMKAQNWLTASKNAQQLLQLNIDYWGRTRLDELMKQLEMEQKGWQQLQEARELAQSNSPLDLDRAIALAGKIDPKSYAKAQAQAERDKWSRALVKIAAERYKEEDYAGVVVMLQRIPAESSVHEEAQDWIRLCRAQYAARQDSILAFLDALSSVRQIGQKSPLNAQAAERMSVWQSHLQDRLQMEFANALASFNQPLTFQLAIDQAQLIGPKRPGRIQAQTEIAHWTKEIQQISDRSALASARQLATPGTIESLKAAVEKAGQIEIGHPLRGEAQTAIAQWTNQIQTIEDQPVLAQARGLAEKGDLIAAVQTARQIRSGRALYPQARDAINDWVAQIQIAQDRPILRAASALADQGRLGEAIQTAAQISAGRPLYRKAQSTIATWQSQLEAARAERERAERERSEPERSDRDQAGAQRAEPERTGAQRAEREQADRDRADRDRAERDRADRDRARRDQAERDQAERDQAERAQARRERARARRERADREQADRDQADRERATTRVVRRRRRSRYREEPPVDTE